MTVLPVTLNVMVIPPLYFSGSTDNICIDLITTEMKENRLALKDILSGEYIISVICHELYRKSCLNSEGFILYITYVKYFYG